MQATSAKLDTASDMSLVRCDVEASDASDKRSSNVVQASICQRQALNGKTVKNIKKKQNRKREN